MEKWFRRFGDVPGIDYTSNPAIDRTQLPGHDAVPKIDRYNFDGRVHESMSWPMEGGSTGTSPSQSWKSEARAGETEAKATLRALQEALELPGTLSNYHFLIQSAHGQLKRFARQESWVLEEFEKLCWLDIHMINAYPDVVTIEPIEISDPSLRQLAEQRRGERTFFHINAFHELLTLYEREGYLREALDVAQVAERFEQCLGKVEEIEERIKRVGSVNVA